MDGDTIILNCYGIEFFEVMEVATVSTDRIRGRSIECQRIVLGEPIKLNGRAFQISHITPGAQAAYKNICLFSHTVSASRRYFNFFNAILWPTGNDTIEYEICLYA